METLTSILISPYMIAVIWPVIFVLFQSFLNYLRYLSNERTIAKGAEKYRVWYSDSKAKRPHSGPTNIKGIVDLFNQGKKIVDISRLEDSLWNLFSFGIDLCISAFATDLSAVIALSMQNSPFARVFVSLAVIHLAMLILIVVILLPSKKPSTGVIWSANALGIVAIIGPFIYFGGLLLT